MPTTLKKKGTAADRAYAELRKRILEGSLAEGAPIRQDELAAELGISKIPVREALMRLQAEQLVTFTPNAGATVSVLTVSDYVEMLDMRLAIECRALELAVPNMAASDIALARTLLNAYNEAMTSEEWSELNASFHNCLYAPANRPRLNLLIRQVQEQMGKFMRRRVSAIAEHERSHMDHIAILNACEARDVKKAVALLRQHIENTQREVQAYFRSQQAR
ncbi:GntR family transcriptional regulator [Paracandidimonas soli]|uniref:GntR family transcriptional regulator n=1 Tax=Paracandidimonas soli TaxID=1917182 RepID=A0A4R3UYW5_9BURK|nr:GntR family transcriptional regulator [Paracandidimonas soli]TCU96063.1 GntR family transcriptional regulator [Paracandidimonas soli]